jgi:hypothetical protein
MQVLCNCTWLRQVTASTTGSRRNYDSPAAAAAAAVLFQQCAAVIHSAMVSYDVI